MFRLKRTHNNKERKFIEGFDERRIVQEKDYWQDVARAQQNKMIVQAEVEAIEEQLDVPCAVVYLGEGASNIKGVIPIYEYGLIGTKYVSTKEDCDDEEKLDNSYKFLRGQIGQRVAFIIKGSDKEANIFVASRAEALEWLRKRTKEEISKDSKTLAVVRYVNPYRAYLDIGGMIATMPAAEYQHGWTDDLMDHLNVGDHLNVKVLDFDEEQGQVIVSRKALIPDPWEQLELMEQSEYNAEITGVREYGCFFKIKTKNGSVSGFMRHPKHDNPKKADRVLVKLLNIDSEAKRITGLYIRSTKVS